MKVKPRQEPEEVIEIARHNCRDRISHLPGEQAHAGVERRHRTEIFPLAQLVDRFLVNVQAIVSVDASARERLLTRVRIRLLVSPEESRRSREEKGVRIDVEEARASLEFGLLQYEPAMNLRIECEKFG